MVLAAALAACGFTGAGGSRPTDIDAPRPADAGADARPIDAPFDAYYFCPPDYDKHGDSYYRVRSAERFSTVHADCKDDYPGRTHVVVIDSSGEHDLVRALAGGDYWLGVVQRADEESSSSGWRAITNVSIDEWGWSDEQPDDSDGEEDNQQNLAARRSGGVTDVSKDDGYIGVCECDGYEIDSDVEDDIP